MKLSKKVVILGHFGVGKSSLFKRFIDNSFSEDYKSTLGVQIQKKTVTLPTEEELAMIIWDTEGHTNIEDHRKSYLLGSHAFIYVFDLTRKDTFENIENELAYLKENYPKTFVKVVGNKLDAVDKTTIAGELTDNNIPFEYLTSAKTAKNVKKLFSELADALVK